MYEEIDLRPYVAAILENWIWIVGAALGAAVVAFGVSSLLPPTYEATALVAITEEQQVVQFDPRFESLVVQQPLGAYPELARSDELLQMVLDEVGDRLPEVDTVQELREMVETEAGNDPTLVRLIVRYGDPAVTTQIANTWAALFVDWSNQVYGNDNEEQLAFYESQLESARAALADAEANLVEFQAENRASILANRLDSLQQTQSDYLAEQRTITFLLQDARSLRDQMDQQAEAVNATFADQLTALALQLRAFNAQGALPLQFQLESADSLTERSRSRQITFLDDLVSTLEERAGQIDERLAELEPQILLVQAEKEQADVEEARLRRDRDVAEETYLAVSRKVDEERITAEDETGTVRLASRAGVPLRPSAPSRLLNSVVGGVLGPLIVVTVIIMLTWWREESVPSSESGEQFTSPAEGEAVRPAYGQQASIEGE